ncbi:MAG: glycosyltransferase family 4 protein [Elusimicrobiota bacterium]
MGYKILQMTYQGDLGGQTKSIYYLSSGLAQMGNEVYLGCRKESFIYKMIQGTGIKPLILDFKKKWDMPLAKKVNNFVKEKGIQIINAHSTLDRNICIILKLLFGTKSKLIFTRRQMPRSFFIKNQIYSIVSDRMIAVSNPVKLELAKSGAKYKKLEVVHNGYSPEETETDYNILEEAERLRKIHNIPSDIPVIGMVSRRKQQELLIKASSLIKRPHAIMFVGINRDESLEKLRKNLNHRHRVIYTGYTNRVLPFYKIMDIFVLSSVTEGLSRAILEAFAMNVPVICTSAGGNTDIVKHKITGMLFEPDDEKRLTQCIQIILSNNNLKKSITEKAGDILKKDFSADKMVENTLEVYTRVLNS